MGDPVHKIFPDEILYPFCSMGDLAYKITILINLYLPFSSNGDLAYKISS